MHERSGPLAGVILSFIGDDISALMITISYLAKMTRKILQFVIHHLDEIKELVIVLEPIHQIENVKSFNSKSGRKRKAVQWQ